MLCLVCVQCGEKCFSYCVKTVFFSFHELHNHLTIHLQLLIHPDSVTNVTRDYSTKAAAHCGEGSPAFSLILKLVDELSHKGLPVTQVIKYALVLELKVKKTQWITVVEKAHLG